MDLVLGPSSLSVPFSFTIPDKTWRGNDVKRVGVYTSGGLDSTALLCLVLSELKATNRLGKLPVVSYTFVKADGSTYYADRIVQKVSEHFGVQIENPVRQNAEPGFTFGRVDPKPIADLCREVNHDTLLYMGINRMAPDDIRPFKHTLKIKYADPMGMFIAPFLDLHKPQITDLYYKLGCEDLIPYTHSCTVKPVGRCNNCYSCSEKAWAFDALGKEYVDTIPPDIDDVSVGGTWGPVR